MSTRILKQIRLAVEQLNPSEVREAAERPVRILLRASSSEGYAAMEDFLCPRELSRSKRMELAQCIFRQDDAGVPDDVDVLLVERGVPGPPSAIEFDRAKPERCVRAVLDLEESLGLPFARRFTPFRGPVSERIIARVSRENAMFSMATSLPNIAPGILALPWALPEAVSDTTVLTINQIRMAFLLAAASDRPVGYREQKMEIGGIIAAAFGWRGIARQLAGKIPLGGGIVPKAAIAYAGTYVEGMSLERMYGRGYGFTRSERSLAYGSALERGRAMVEAFVDAYREKRGAAAPGPRIVRRAAGD
jgi:hypothetical protein